MGTSNIYSPLERQARKNKSGIARRKQKEGGAAIVRKATKREKKQGYSSYVYTF